jgi:hypothetical protein
MPGVIIFKTNEPKHYYGYIFPDQPTYRTAKHDIRGNKDEILWKKGNVSLEQARNAEETMNSLVKKLNDNDEVNLESELAKVADFFPCEESN